MLNRLNAIKFVMAVSFVSTLILALFYSSVKDRVEENVLLDKKQSILKTIGIDTSILSSDEVDLKYKNHIDELVIDADGNIVDNVLLSDIIWKEDKSTGMTNYLYSGNENQYLPLYRSKDENGDITGYIIPISGKGLWSTMMGYFAIGEDKDSVLGIVFYSHGETPGLGAEVDKPWFQDQFKSGKKIFDRNEKQEKNDLVSIVVNKKKNTSEELHQVDGITGATVTSDGITKFLKRDLERYLKFLKNKDIVDAKE